MKILVSIICFSIILSCQQPSTEDTIEKFHKSLVTQREYFYEVEYIEGHKNKEPAFHLYGTGKLSRNKQSIISGFYFGIEEERKDNYMLLIKHEGESIEQLDSLIFNDKAIDVLSDSLHSAVLLNPDLIYSLLENASHTNVVQNEEKDIHYVEFLEQSKRKILIHFNENNLITEIVIENYPEKENGYYRSWSFNYLTKNKYKEQLAVYEKQNFENPKAFL